MLARVFSAIERFIFPQFPRQFPALAVAGVDNRLERSEQGSGLWESLKNTLEDAIVWAVPKSRRTVEKRMMRKFGSPEKPKLLQVKTHLKICITCGHHYEVGVLCPHCYNRVRKETKQMQEEIKQNLGLKPIEQDVIVLYEGEKLQGATAEMWQGKRIVEMKRPRPAWFSKNLMEKTTQPPATTKEVKPTDLG
ncbi:large ribosomal subunit protein bL32m [Phlebotomus argentipes]|uniref:large ribosomal subunit protein bL32m n=1 Tax=Phlebotomus argentipes TaxID=94469 RepID=UPI002893079D|nr:large ribosomal subunit protein bL32m [Phlebotomus argentipes]